MPLLLTGCSGSDNGPAPPPPTPERPQSVTTVSPPAQTISAARDTSLTMTFAEPLDPSSVDASNLYVFGRWSGVAQGAITLEETNTLLRFTPNKPFMAGEWITVLLSDKVQSAAGEPLTGGYTWNFWTKTEPASLDLTFVTNLEIRRGPDEGPILSYGAYAGDLDGDGFSDLLIPNEAPNDIRVFMNDTLGGYNGDFTTYVIPNGSNPSPNEGADFNRDGILDVAVGNRMNAVVSVFSGLGGGQLSLDNYTADQQVRAVCVLDANGDGFMDIATANTQGSGGAGNVTILMNDGAGKFGNPAIFTAPGNTGEAACAAADANGDGLLDLFVGTLNSSEILVFLGDGAGGLQLHSRTAAGGTSWMLAAGDLNGDGHADVVSANSSTGNLSPGNLSVLFGDGAGNLSQAVSYPPGGGSFPLAVDLGDIDGDSDLDLIVSNFPNGIFTLFENDGAGNFINPRPIAAPQVASCAILHDRDNDGDLDFTGIDERDDLILLYRNGL